MFKCDKCGSCCQLVDQNEIFIHLDRGDGICKYYSESQNICLIYDERPIICRVDDYYKEYFANHIDINEYYRLNYEACNKCRKLVEGGK